jgi:hypothetical protein
MTAVRRVSFAMVLAAGVAGCQPDEPQLVAMHGCGLEQEDLSGLRIVVRGDFPPSSETELLLVPGESGRFDELPGNAAGLTVEGLIGDTPIAVGRTAGVGADQMVVYFAPPNSVCSVPSGISFRDAGGIALGREGEVLIAGGRDGFGALTDELVLVDLSAESAEVLAATLPAPTAGQSLHRAADRRFVMVGGARGGDRWFSTLAIDLDAADPVRPPVPLEVSGSTVGVAYHGAATAADGKVMIAGGCESIDDQGRCAVDPDDPATVSRQAFWIDPEDPTDTDAAPDLLEGRFGLTLLVGRDGVAFAVGGRDGLGQPVLSVERLVVDGPSWELLGEELPAPVAGAALLEDGLVVLALADGSGYFVSDSAQGELPSGQSPELPAAPHRPMLALPGERIVTDAWLLPVGSADPQATAVDLTVETPAGAGPAQRVGPSLLSLDDGSALLIGGRTLSDQPAAPYLARVRPPLDGPDEELPDVAGPDPDAFVSNPPTLAVVDGKDLVLSGAGTIEEFPTDRVHVRGFRSRSFSFDFVVDVNEARAHVMLLQGAMEALSLRLDADGVVARRRGADGQLKSADCELGPDPQLNGNASLRLDVSQGAIRLEQAGEELATCSGLEGPPASVGLGVSGNGEVRVRQMRLSRR